MNSTYAEKDENTDKFFFNAVKIVEGFLKREIKRAKDFIDSTLKMKEIYEKTEDKRIIVLDDDYSWQKFFADYSEPLFIIKPVSFS